MKKVSDFLSIVSGVFAVIPGLVILTSKLGVPPNTSTALFGGVVEALGVFALLLLWLNKNWIKKTRIKTINRLSVICICIFILCLFSYIFLFNYLVVEVPDTDAVFFPLWANGELKTGIATAGGRNELIAQWGRDDVYKVIQASSKTPLLLTTLLLLLIYQLTFVSLTVSFGLPGIKGTINKTTMKLPAQHSRG